MFLSTTSPSLAHDIKHKALQIVHPWAHESKTGRTSADVFMTIRNTSRTADRLVSAATARAGEVQLVTVAPGTLAIKPGRETKLSATTAFVKLLGLTKPLYVHDNFTLTLVFEKAGRIEVEVHIEEAHVQEPHKH